MGAYTQPILASMAIAVLATAGLWLFVMPDEPERAADDGILAAAIASLVVTEKVRRDLTRR